MPASRVFVSYLRAEDERGTEIANQLITDLRSNSLEIVTDDEHISDENFMAFLSRELPQCQYLILIQTPATLRSPRVQIAVNMALTLAAQQQTPRVLRLIATPSEGNDVQPRWNAVRTFDASVDYPRAYAKLFLELDLIRLDESSPSLIAIPCPSSGTSAPLPRITPFSDQGLPPAQPFGFPQTVPTPSGHSGPIAPLTVQPSSSGQLTQLGVQRPPSGQLTPPGIQLSSSGQLTQLGVQRPPSGQLTPPGIQPSSSGQLTQLGVQRPPSGQLTPPGIQLSPATNQNLGQAGPYSTAAPAFLPLSSPTSQPENTYYPFTGGNDQPASPQHSGWLKQSLESLRTRIATQTGNPPMQVVLDDRPLPLNTTRRMVIRWVSAIALILVLITGATVAIVQFRNHTASRPNKTNVITTISHGTSTALATKSVTSTPQVFPTQGITMVNPDPRSTVDVYATGSTLTLNDNLAGNDSQYQWQVSSSGGTSCLFKNKSYNLASTGLTSCVASKSNFSNFIYQIQLRITQGTTAGIVFRADSGDHTYYFFQITTDGHFSLWRSDSATNPPVQIPKTAGFASAINKGLNQPNVIAVSAIGDHIICFINKTPVIDVHDNTYTSGSIGVIAVQGSNNGPTNASYQFAKVWTLP